jgi:hypothetical protein
VATSRDPIEHVASTDFAGNFTDVTHITSTAPSGFVLGTAVPPAATRSPGDGGVVSFDFNLPNDEQYVDLGSCSNANDDKRTETGKQRKTPTAWRSSSRAENELRPAL